MEIFGKKIDGVMIFVAILVIAGLTWGLVTVVNNLFAKGSSAVSSQSAMLDSAQYEAYNNKLVSGDTVINLIRSEKNIDSTKIRIVVLSNKSGTNYNTALYGWMLTSRTDNTP
jgi:hypothetical protein